MISTVYYLLFASDSDTVKKHLWFGWDFDLADDFTADKANEMKEQLRQQFVYWNTNLTTLHPGTAFCANVNCTDVSITVTNNNANFRIKIDVDKVAYVSLPSFYLNTSCKQIMIHLILQQEQFTY